jgi:hypothetical protein
MTFVFTMAGFAILEGIIIFLLLLVIFAFFIPRMKKDFIRIADLSLLISKYKRERIAAKVAAREQS